MQCHSLPFLVWISEYVLCDQALPQYCTEAVIRVTGANGGRQHGNEGFELYTFWKENNFSIFILLNEPSNGTLIKYQVPYELHVKELIPKHGRRE